jgi:ParB-like chromosome segregation protein Spo0J
VNHIDTNHIDTNHNDTRSSQAAGKSEDRETSEHQVAVVPITSVLPGDSPRLDGEDKAHIARLAETEAALPPILVDRRRMRVIDGMHRLMAASLKGQETIDVEFFDGDAAEAFLLAVEANVTHGLPLSQADRRAAASRIIASHPEMSDRLIGKTAGLAAKTVAAIRRRSTDACPQLNRVGRDGKVRPLNSASGRQRAAALISERPEASLRDVARRAGVSPATVRDVRIRMERGDDAMPPKVGQARHGDAGPSLGRNSRRRVRPPVPQLSNATLNKLLRDPSLRHNEQGRRLLRSMQSNAAVAHEWSGVIAAVPPHCAEAIAQMAHQYGKLWLDFAQNIELRARETFS